MKQPPVRLNRRITNLRIVGLDPSLTHLGVAILDGVQAKLHTVASGKLRDMERLHFLMREVQTLIIDAQKDAAKNHARLVIVREDYAYAASSGSDAVLKELGGILMWELDHMGLPLYRVGVAQVKKFVVGSGNAQKDQMMLAIYKNFGVYSADEHQADAVGVAFTAQALITRAYKTAAQKAVIESAVRASHPLTKLQ